MEVKSTCSWQTDIREDTKHVNHSSGQAPSAHAPQQLQDGHGLPPSAAPKRSRACEPRWGLASWSASPAQGRCGATVVSTHVDNVSLLYGGYQ